MVRLLVRLYSDNVMFRIITQQVLAASSSARSVGEWFKRKMALECELRAEEFKKILIWIRQWVPPSGILYIWILNDQSPAEICLSQGDLSRRRVETKRNWKQGCGETVMLRTKMAKMRELESYRELNWSVKISQRMKF